MFYALLHSWSVADARARAHPHPHSECGNIFMALLVVVSVAARQVGQDSHEAILAQAPHSLPHGEQRGAWTTIGPFVAQPRQTRVNGSPAAGYATMMH